MIYQVIPFRCLNMTARKLKILAFAYDVSLTNKSFLIAEC